MFHGIGTLYYLPFAFFNIANPIISIMFGVLGIGLARATVGEDGAPEPEAEPAPGAPGIK